MAREPRLLVARPADRIRAACGLARRHGFDPVPAPVLEVVPGDGRGLPAALEALRAPRSWAVFTSPTGVAAAFALAAARGLDLAALLQGAGVAAVGPSTAAALAARGCPARVPARHDSAGLVDLLAAAGVAGAPVALLRSDRGTAELPEGLAAEGARVLDVPVYGLALPRDLGPAHAALDAAAAGDLAAAAFTSSLGARHFLELARGRGLEPAVLRGLARARVGALGDPTARALAALGVRVDAVPAAASFPALLAILRQRLPEVPP